MAKMPSCIERTREEEEARERVREATEEVVLARIRADAAARPS